MKLIAIEYLYEGMEVAENIYNHSGKVLLIAKGIVLTEQIIKQLKSFTTDNRNISVSESIYNELIERGIETPVSSGSGQTAQNEESELSDELRYRALIRGMLALLEKTAALYAVPKDDTDILVHEISDFTRSVSLFSIFRCINLPHEIDEYLGKHSLNSALLNAMIGRRLKLGEQEIASLIQAGLLHDIGKIKIPLMLLDLPRKLTICEYEVVKTHPLYSCELFGRDQRFLKEVKAAVMFHHERMDKSGYPQGLAGAEIPLFAKITAISDVYDAMISKRPYKDALNPFAALSDLEKQCFSELDASLVALLTEQISKALIGSTVLLSDKSVAMVTSVPEEDLEYPLVELGGKVKKTDDKLYCVSMVYKKHI